MLKLVILYKFIAFLAFYLARGPQTRQRPKSAAQCPAQCTKICTMLLHNPLRTMLFTDTLSITYSMLMVYPYDLDRWLQVSTDGFGCVGHGTDGFAGVHGWLQVCI